MLPPALLLALSLAPWPSIDTTIDRVSSDERDSEGMGHVVLAPPPFNLEGNYTATTEPPNALDTCPVRPPEHELLAPAAMPVCPSAFALATPPAATGTGAHRPPPAATGGSLHVTTTLCLQRARPTRQRAPVGTQIRSLF